MRYHVMYTFVVQSVRYAKIMDFKKWRIIRVSLMEIQTNTYLQKCGTILNIRKRT